jgi:ribonuclease P protein component
MNGKYRLRKSTDFKRVRRLGKSYAHPFVVLVKHPNREGCSRFGISAGRSIGNAVERNRAKRRIREIIRPRITKILDGWDIVFLARNAINQASYIELKTALDELIIRAELSTEPYVN